MVEPTVYVFRIGHPGDSLVSLPAVLKLAETYLHGD
jgi:hypothetical protein